MAALRRALPAEQRKGKGRALARRVQLLPEWQRADRIALYAALAEPGELALDDLDVAARALGKHVYYPCSDVLDDGRTRTGFRRVVDPGELVERGQRFREPDPRAPWALPGELDLIVVPALAADASGQRVGYGAGWYDATLGEFRPPACALIAVYDFQLVGELPREPNDVPCDAVVTEARVLRAPGA